MYSHFSPIFWVNENIFIVFVFIHRSPKLQIVKRKKVVDAGEPIDMNSALAKKKKNKFLSDISGDIVRHLKPYLKENCQVGHIQNSEDFKHLARKVITFICTIATKPILILHTFFYIHS